MYRSTLWYVGVVGYYWRLLYTYKVLDAGKVGWWLDAMEIRQVGGTTVD